MVAAGFVLAASSTFRMAESPFQTEPRDALRHASRIVYRFSVIPGGAYDGVEAAAAVARDPVVAIHYQGFDVRRANPVRTRRDLAMYVSYRRSNSVYWTSVRVPIPAGEQLLSDGKEVARARCGNRLSDQPRMPTGYPEPTPSELESSFTSPDGSPLLLTEQSPFSPPVPAAAPGSGDRVGQVLRPALESRNSFGGLGPAPRARSSPGAPSGTEAPLIIGAGDPWPMALPDGISPNPRPSTNDALFAPPAGGATGPGPSGLPSGPPFFPGHLTLERGSLGWEVALPKPHPDKWQPADFTTKPIPGSTSSGGPLTEGLPPGLLLPPPDHPPAPAPPFPVPEPTVKLLVLLALGGFLGLRKVRG